MSEKQQPLPIIDPDNYRRLSVPFESLAAAESAVRDFWKEFYELRNKHKLPDVYVIFRYSALGEDGKAAEYLGQMDAGSSIHCLGMTAFAYGQETKRHKERIGKLLHEASE